MTSPLGKLKPEIKTRWRAALESEKYPQCTDKLKSSEGFCCLGVLGDLAVEDGVASWNGDILVVKNSSQSERNNFPESLLKWAFEVKPNTHCTVSNFPYFTNSKVRKTNCLTYANDSGTTFPEISKLIEENF
jgi:hypothetical protein